MVTSRASLGSSLGPDMKTILILCVIIGIFACGTHLNAQSAQDEQAGQVISAAGFHAHDGGPDQLRYETLFCKSREVLLQAGQPYTDSGIPCK